MALTAKKQHRGLRRIARIEARLDPEQKRRIEYAARLKGTSISEFLVTSADSAAARTIEQHEVWTLTGRDREVVVKALLRPPAPTQRLKAIVRRYRHEVRAM